jgi:hypothetical protein
MNNQINCKDHVYPEEWKKKEMKRLLDKFIRQERERRKRGEMQRIEFFNVEV